MVRMDGNSEHAPPQQPGGDAVRSSTRETVVRDSEVAGEDVATVLVNQSAESASLSFHSKATSTPETPDAIRRSRTLREKHQESLARLSCGESVSSGLSERLAELRERRLKLELALQDNLRSLELENLEMEGSIKAVEQTETAAFDPIRIHAAPSPHASLDSSILHRLISSLLAERQTSSPQILKPTDSADFRANDCISPSSVQAGPALPEPANLHGLRTNTPNNASDEERGWHWVHRCIDSLHTAMKGLERVDRESVELQREGLASSFLELKSGSVSGSLDCSQNGPGPVADSWSLRSSYELSTVLGGHSKWGAHEEMLDDEGTVSLLNDELQTISSMSDDAGSDVEGPEVPRSVLGSAAMLVSQAPSSIAPEQQFGDAGDSWPDAGTTELEEREAGEEFPYGGRHGPPPLRVRLKPLSALGSGAAGRYSARSSRSPRLSEAEPGAEAIGERFAETPSSPREEAKQEAVAVAIAHGEPLVEEAESEEAATHMEELFALVLALKADVAKVVETLATPKPGAVGADQNSARVLDAIGTYIQQQSEVVEALSAGIRPAPALPAGGLGTLRSLSTILEQTASQLFSLVPGPLATTHDLGSPPHCSVGDAQPLHTEGGAMQHEEADGRLGERPCVSAALAQDSSKFVAAAQWPAAPSEGASPLQSTHQDVAALPSKMEAPLAMPSPLQPPVAEEPGRLDQDKCFLHQALLDTTAVSLERFDRTLADAAPRRAKAKLSLTHMTAVELYAVRTPDDGGDKPPAASQTEHSEAASQAEDTMAAPQIEDDQDGTTRPAATAGAEKRVESSSRDEDEKEHLKQLQECMEQLQAWREEARTRESREATERQKHQDGGRYRNFVDERRQQRAAMVLRLNRDCASAASARRGPGRGDDCAGEEAGEEADEGVEALLAEREELLRELEVLGAAVGGRRLPPARPASDPPQPAPAHPTPPPTAPAPRKFCSADARAALAARLAGGAPQPASPPRAPAAAPEPPADPSSQPSRTAPVSCPAVDVTNLAGRDCSVERHAVSQKERQTAIPSAVGIVKQDPSLVTWETQPLSKRGTKAREELPGLSRAEKSTQSVVSDPSADINDSLARPIDAMIGGTSGSTGPEPPKAEDPSMLNSETAQIAAIAVVESCAVQTNFDIPPPRVAGMSTCIYSEMGSQTAGQSMHRVGGVDIITQDLGVPSMESSSTPRRGAEEARSSSIPISLLLNEASQPGQHLSSDEGTVPQPTLGMTEQEHCLVAEDNAELRRGTEHMPFTSAETFTQTSRRPSLDEAPAAESWRESAAVLRDTLAAAQALLDLQRQEDREPRAQLVVEQGRLAEAVSRLQEAVQANGASAALSCSDLQASVAELQARVHGVCARLEASAEVNQQTLASSEARLPTLLEEAGVAMQATVRAALSEHAAGSRDLDALQGRMLGEVLDQFRQVAAELQVSLRRMEATRASHSDATLDTSAACEDAGLGRRRRQDGRETTELAGEECSDHPGGMLPASGPAMELANKAAPEGDHHHRRMPALEDAGQSKGLLELDLSSFPLGPGCGSMLALRCREVGPE